MASKQSIRILALVITCAFLCAPLAPAAKAMPVTVEGGDQPVVNSSNRLIVELDSPPLAAAYRNTVSAAAINGKLDANVPAAQAYINQLQAEQAAFVSTMQAAVAGATVANFVNENGLSEQATYQVVFNGLSVDVGRMIGSRRLCNWQSCRASKMFIWISRTTRSCIPAPL